ncbi:hypothetical protein ANCDUO_12425 [Ancylostoma duodenale]|uniref:Uncharacterized protein n=1 Tax=Ancylostoma duodenale TaxID=51022 RepID=A0A0C2GES9_9BILA|nr:hypothetical protein ANCDUO_12425 [Ancylostoma duodenale]
MVKSKGYSPFFVAYGRHPSTWSDIVHQLPSRLTFATESFADQLTAALQTTIMDVGNQIARKTATYKSGYDYQNKVYAKDISTGDLVLLRDDTVRPKFTHQWKGPFVVKSVSRPNATIANLIGRTSSQMVHMNRLKIYSPRSTSANVSTPNQTIDTPSISETSEAEEPNLRRSRRIQLKQQTFSSTPPAPAQEN